MAAPALDILVCDDDWLIRTNMVDMLGEAGYRPTGAATGREALDILDRQQVDVLIADIGLPDMSGVDLAITARRLLPELGIIFVSGYSETDAPSNVPGALRINKPFQINEIEHALEKLFGTSP
jgi:CheY-like chemotaxis protein